MSNLTTYFGIFDGLRGSGIELTLDEARSASHQGRCDEDVEALCKKRHIAKQLDDIGVATIKAGLKEVGAWTDEELSDRTQNRRRAVWIAAGNILEDIREQAAE